MDAALYRVRDLDARMDECVHDAERAALQDERKRLWASFGTLPVSVVPGLQYVRMELSNSALLEGEELRESLSRAEHVVKRLLQNARQTPVAVPLASKSILAKPIRKKKARDDRSRDDSRDDRVANTGGAGHGHGGPGL